MRPATSERLERRGSEHVNRRIRRAALNKVALYAGNADLIDDRLEELKSEWDAQRVLELSAAGLGLLGVILGAFWSAAWLLLSAAALIFLMLHALGGWCPPEGLFRRVGFRTRREIDEEAYALKALRGDFADVAPPAVGEPRTLASRALDDAAV